MKSTELSELSDQELLKEAKKRKYSRIQYAFIIGFLIGIIVYSVAKNTWGFLTLIPLYFIYRLVKDSKYDSKELEEILKERNLK